MAPDTIPFIVRSGDAAIGARTKREKQHLALNAEDGTLHLLHSGFLIAGIAALCLCLTLWILGGIGPDGPTTQPGWLALMIALMCMPFGLLLLLLGGAKWLRNRGLSRSHSRIPAKHSR
jgi:hypothetical protein